jgi:hypothetical protein
MPTPAVFTTRLTKTSVHRRHIPVMRAREPSLLPDWSARCAPDMFIPGIELPVCLVRPANANSVLSFTWRRNAPPFARTPPHTRCFRCSNTRNHRLLLSQQTTHSQPEPQRSGLAKRTAVSRDFLEREMATSRWQGYNVLLALI